MTGPWGARPTGLAVVKMDFGRRPARAKRAGAFYAMMEVPGC